MAEKKDVATLKAHFSNIVHRLRKSAVKGTTGGISAGTTVRSVFGYQRWARSESDAGEVQNEELPDNDREPSPIEESVPLNIDIESDEVEPAEGTESESSHTLEAVLSKSSTHSSISINEPVEPAVTKVDSITEWQAGWNVTNAIQVGSFNLPFCIRICLFITISPITLYCSFYHNVLKVSILVIGFSKG